MTLPTTTPAYAAARNITVRFGDIVAVDDVSVDVAQGEVVAVIGPSGSGKSTLLRCFNWLQHPTSGSITIDGETYDAGARRPPSHKQLMQLRRSAGMVFQSFNLFPHLTALENIVLAQTKALGRSKAEARDRAMELLGKVGLEDRADHRPAECSGGQQQRIAIARAVAMDPKVMLFDEPTSALDPEVGVEVLQVMRNLADTGMTMLVVTHEMSFAEDVADRVVFMDHGRITEHGAAQQVLRDPQHERTQQFLQAVRR
jgi:polar amino acid transport system ATP-binding protein